MCLCETKYQGGVVSHHFAGALTSLKWYIAAREVSQYRAMWGLSVLFSFPVLFWCRFYPRFFLSAKGIWGLKKAQF